MTTSAIVGNGTFYRLGIPKALNITTVTVDTASSKQDEELPQSRAYIYTYVSAYGEEGQPCEALTNQVIDVFSDQNVVLTLPSAPSGNHNLSKKRIYRTDTSGTFRFVADVTLSATTYTDSLTEQQLGKQLHPKTLIHPLMMCHQITLMDLYWV